jgi:hypothetical protein
VIGGFIIKYSGYSAMYLIAGIAPLLAAMAIFALTWTGLKKRLY